MERLKTLKCLALAIIDFCMIGVIIYGVASLAYEGYPKFVPYLIMVFFFIMALLRIREFSSILKSADSVDKENIEDLFIDGEKSTEEAPSRGFRRRSKKSASKFNKH